MRFLYLILAPVIGLSGCSSNISEIKQGLPQTSPTESRAYTQNTEYHFDGLINEDDPRHPPTRLRFYEEDSGKVNILEVGSVFGPSDKYIDVDDDLRPDRVQMMLDGVVVGSRDVFWDSSESWLIEEAEVAKRGFQGYLEVIKQEKAKKK